VEVRELEAAVKRCCEEGDLHQAATLAIQGYGPEVLGFLAVLVDRADAGEVFADVCVRLWKSLRSFRWDASLRTWVYVLARRACQAYLKERASYRDRHMRFSEVPEIDAMIARVRTTTIEALGPQRGMTRVERLRSALSPDEQTLLTLRLDRELDWRAIARVLADADGDLTETELVRESALLRKRFERIKEKLKKLAEKEG
jgi:RNA polymerase sigma-70 factor (ECF subfamily)